MLGNIWRNDLLYRNWLDDGASCFDQYSSFVCDYLLSEKKAADCLDMAARTIFYTNCWICIVSADRTRFPKEQNV